MFLLINYLSLTFCPNSVFLFMQLCSNLLCILLHICNGGGVICFGAVAEKAQKTRYRKQLIIMIFFVLDKTYVVGAH